MKRYIHVIWLALGLTIGIGAMLWQRPAPQAVWAGNDRHEDYIMCTGPIALGPNFSADGVWLLDYRAGKLLGTMVDRNVGKIVGWAEVDLVKEFNIPPKQNVHFMMTTGSPIGNPGVVPIGVIPVGAAPQKAPDGKGPPPMPAPGGVAFGAQGMGNTALYLTEINTGRFGVYTMGPRPDGAPGMIIRRHDATLFRQPAPQ